MLKAYSKQDPPPNRVKPVPIPVIRRIMAVATATVDPFNNALADMIYLAFYFLLCPGEYAISSSESTPFEFKDVQLLLDQQRLELTSATPAQILSCTFASLTFDKQKNDVHGEVVGHTPTGPLTFAQFVPLVDAFYTYKPTMPHQTHLCPKSSQLMV